MTEFVRSDKKLAALARYTVNNPVRRGFVRDWRAYKALVSLAVFIAMT
jgi:hypothetical protein